MDILEHFYENPPRIKGFVPRKCSLGSENTLLYGPKGCGKSYLLIDHLLQSEANFLYLDLEDLRVDHIETIPLQTFLKEENITLLAIENYDFSFALPDFSGQCILTSRQRFSLPGFTPQRILHFDFEEYLATTQKSPTQSFNTYLKRGTGGYNYQLVARASFDSNTLQLFCHLCSLAGRAVSVNQIYLAMKQHCRISKDWLYKTMERLQEEHYIFFIPKKDAPKAQKKLFIYNHGFINALSLHTSFIGIFQNLIVNEMIKKSLQPFYGELNKYTVGNTLYSIEPFASEEASWVRVQKFFSQYKKQGIEAVRIITVSSHFSFTVGGLRCEALPFYEWAIVED